MLADDDARRLRDYRKKHEMETQGSKAEEDPQTVSNIQSERTNQLPRRQGYRDRQPLDPR